MTEEIVNALGGYFETLYNLNRDLITLCGVDVIDNSGQYEVIVKNVIQAVPRLVPYVYNKDVEKYVILPHDGLLEFVDHITFLKDDYESILENHYDFLKNVKIIRNKFEHKMHGARLMGGSSGGLSSFDMTYLIGDREITLTATEIIRFTKDINTLFYKIQKLVNVFAYENGKAGYRYYRRLTRYNFCDFNKILDSEILKIVGKSLFPF